MNFELKIVEGPNKGAEIALVEGIAVTMGKGDDCDIILADPTLPDSPLKIEVSADAVSLDGEPLDLLHVKTAGSTAFAAGPAGEAWGALVWPEKEGSSFAKATEDETGNGERGTGKLEKEVGEKGTDESGEERPEKPARGKRRAGCLAPFLVIPVLLAALAGLVWYFREWLAPRVEPYRPQAEAALCWTRENAKSAYLWCRTKYRGWREGRSAALVVPVRDPADEIAEIAKRYGLEVSETNDFVTVSGNLKTRVERLSATAEAYAAMPGVNLDLSDDESFRTAAEDALFTLTEGALKAAAATNRVIVLCGKTQSPHSLKKILDSLNEDLPKLRNVDASEVRFGAPAGAHSGKSGVCAKPGTQKKAEPAFPVCGILTMPYPCLVMRDGRRVMEGAVFGEWTVKKINADSVELENHSGRVVWRP